MQSHDDSATPARGDGRADDTPSSTENGGTHSPGQAVISCIQYHDDSPVGPIHVIASMKVVETAYAIDDPDAPPFIEVESAVEPENTDDQPDIWRVVYCHCASLIFSEMGQYLNRFCLAPAEVLKTFWSLDFPAEVSTEVEKYRPEAVA